MFRRGLSAPLLAASLALAMLAAGAGAKTRGAPMAVSANVLAGCQVAADGINFGLLVVGAATNQTDASGAVRLQCSPGTAYRIALGPGVNGTGFFGLQRRMANGVNTLNYDLYSDAARSAPWRDNFLGLFPEWTVAGTAIGGAQVIPVYARLPAGQTPPAGFYLDTVTATVSY